MKIKKTALFLCIFLLIIGCEKEKTNKENSHSKWEVNMGFTEDVLLYRNSATDRVEYFDYQTGYYGPLCAKPNCLHSDLECMAYYMGEKVGQIG